MGFFSKRYEKTVGDINIFLKDTATRINALNRYAENNPSVLEKLKELQQLFQYTVAPSGKDAKKEAHRIAKRYEALKKTLQAPAWNEAEVIHMMNQICVDLEELNAMRKL